MLGQLSRIRLVVACLVFSVQTQAAGYFIESRTPAPDLYVYLGADWLGDQDDAPDFYRVTPEARIITPDDWEFAVRAQAVHAALPNRDLTDAGDTTLSLGKGFRDALGLNFLSIEYGEVFSTAPPEFSSGVKRYGRLRAQGGYTRAGFDASLTFWDLAPTESDVADAAVTGSLGFRTQHGEFHLGADIVTTARRGVGPVTKADAVVMFRRASGSAIYGTLETGLSGDTDGWYVGFGYEFRFALD